MANDDCCSLLDDEMDMLNEKMTLTETQKCWNSKIQMKTSIGKSCVKPCNHKSPLGTYKISESDKCSPESGQQGLVTTNGHDEMNFVIKKVDSMGNDCWSNAGQIKLNNQHEHMKINVTLSNDPNSHTVKDEEVMVGNISVDRIKSTNICETEPDFGCVDSVSDNSDSGNLLKLGDQQDDGWRRPQKQRKTEYQRNENAQPNFVSAQETINPDECEHDEVESTVVRKLNRKRKRTKPKKKRTVCVEGSSDLQVHVPRPKGNCHTCSACGKTFRHFSDLQRHSRQHTGEKPYGCSTCGKRFAQSGDFRKHIRIHTGEKPHVCQTCSKGFSQATYLKLHVRTHTGEQPHVCSTCNKGFSSSSNLRKHIRIHTGERPHACPHCDKSFSQAVGLQRHILTHTGEKPFSCTVCARTFTGYANLRRHLQTHSGDKPHLCATCGKAFSRTSHLRKHIRTHTGEKPYKCAFCGKAFSSQSNYQVHVRSHTDERPHVCSMCGKGFTQRGQLKNHERIHTGEKPCICNICGQGFGRPNYLWKHKQKSHAHGITHCPDTF